MEKNNKKNDPCFKTAEVITLVLITCIVSLLMGIMIPKQPQNKEYEKVDDQLQEFIKQYNYITNNYYDDVDKEQLIQAALEGMLESLNDPYSSYMDENSSNNFNATLNGSYNGIGIEIVNDINKNIIIRKVYEDTPASKVGLEPFDIIKSINGKSVANTTTVEFTNIVKKINSDNFTLEIERNNKIFQISVNKSQVILPSVASQLFEENNKKIGYIYVSIFAANTDSQFKSKLQELESKNIDSLIIDLRGNSGGHLSSVENMVSMFLDSNNIIYQMKDKVTTTKYYSKGDITKKYPIVILIDNGSASASEMMTAALKESYGATLIGKTTYGKGTVQELQGTNNNQYKITTKKWLTPNGTWVNKVGVAPDIDISIGNKYIENPTIENDQQLQKALEILTK